MALRLVEARIPRQDVDRIGGLLEDIPVVDLWVDLLTVAGDDGVGFVRVLVDANEAEGVLDALVDAFGSNDGFRVMLLPVEATLPQPDEASDEDGDDENGEQQREPQRISREELYADLAESTKLTTVYVVMVALSALVAAVGLIRGDVAIIIGAMVIAPLLGPNVALSLAATLGDPGLAWRSLKAIGVGVATAGGVSLLIGMSFAFDPTPEIITRTRAQVGDFALALAAGAAGSLSFTTGVPAVVVGVMVAVALLPPLVAAGLLLGAGYMTAATGALIVLLTNVTCINLAAVATFLLQKVRPRTWWEADRAKKATIFAVVTWIIMLGVLVTLILLGLVEGLELPEPPGGQN